MAGADEFTPTHNAPIVVSWVVNLAWTIWPAVSLSEPMAWNPQRLATDAKAVAATREPSGRT